MCPLTLTASGSPTGDAAGKAGACCNTELNVYPGSQKGRLGRSLVGPGSAVDPADVSSSAGRWASRGYDSMCDGVCELLLHLISGLQ